MITVKLTSPDIDKQMDVLKHFPDIADRHYRPAVKLAVEYLYARIAPNIPVRTGAASQSFNSQVTGKAFSLRGKVGWFKSGDPWYINVVEHGAKAHEIQVEPAKMQSLKWGDGNFSKGHTIRHPGLSARGFMAAGYSAVQAEIEQDLAMANERIVAELAAI